MYRHMPLSLLLQLQIILFVTSLFKKKKDATIEIVKCLVTNL